jgi:two-component system sensor histidine kinase MprB
MSLRRRMVVLTGAAVAFAVVLSAGAAYLAVNQSLRGRVDHQLKAIAGNVAILSHLPRGGPRPARVNIRRIPRRGLASTGDSAVFDAAGKLYRAPGDHTAFPLTSRDLAVARGRAPAYFREARVGGIPVRVYVSRAGRGRGVIAESALTELHSTLHQLALILGVIALIGVAVAALLGLLVARAGSAPVHAMRQAAEHVGSTGDLTRRIAVSGDDDLGRLGESFNRMLAALEESQRTQRQLIGDASHELRTPIASIRTNLEVLVRNHDLDPRERTPLLRDLIEQMTELGALVEDLLESARDGEGAALREMLQLDELISTEIGRCVDRHPLVQIDARLEPYELVGVESRLRRAIGNVLDNAAKWTPPGASIEVSLARGVITVRDHGPGFRESDLPHVFDRFYRSAAARAVAGSGLGLSIVQKVLAEHGGSVRAANAPGGGGLVTLVLSEGGALLERAKRPSRHQSPRRPRSGERVSNP